MIEVHCQQSGSSGNLYLVKSGKTKILLECGMKEKDIRDFLKREGVIISSLDACIISHKHNDHSESLLYVSRFMEVYGTQQMFSDKKFIGGKVIYDKTNLSVGDLRIKPIQVSHGGCDNFAFIFKDNESCVFFGTDFSLLAPPKSNTISKLGFKFDEVWIECNYVEETLKMDMDLENETLKNKLTRQLNTHMSLNNCIKHLETFNLSNCKRINLIHISKDEGDPRYMCNAIESKFGIPTYAIRKYEDMKQWKTE